MWKLYEAVNNTVSSLLTNIVSSEDQESIRVTRFKNLYEDAIQIIGEMRECPENERGDWIHITNVQKDLNQMVDILLEEENQLKTEKHEGASSSDDRGVCMDILVKQHIIDSLCGVAMVDDPPGSTEMITLQLTRLFREVKYPLLSTETTHITISVLVQKLMQLYQGKNVPLSLETAIIQFVEVFCSGEMLDRLFVRRFVWILFLSMPSLLATTQLQAPRRLMLSVPRFH